MHDQIDLQKYITYGSGYQKLAEIVQDYHKFLHDRHLVDFALLEREILKRLKHGRLLFTVKKLQALLVDEFQDTNYLQEQIYYELCHRSGSALTVVGDDDQSIFRFRGATVEIFSDFSNRLSASLGKGWQPLRVDLTENYRSTERIVNFCNHFITCEADFQAARTPGKQASLPAAQWAKDPDTNVPVFGLFRTTIEELSADLCEFLGRIFCDGGWTMPIDGGNSHFAIKPAPGGDFGDAVLLAWKVGEENNNGAPRLPLLMRQELRRNYGVEVFNPRGRVLATISEVAQCLGLMLECIDPDGQVQDSISTLGRNARTTFNNWRLAARQFVDTNPDPGGLGQFLQDWAARTSKTMKKWPVEWPLLERDREGLGGRLTKSRDQEEKEVIG